MVILEWSKWHAVIANTVTQRTQSVPTLKSKCTTLTSDEDSCRRKLFCISRCISEGRMGFTLGSSEGKGRLRWLSRAVHRHVLMQDFAHLERKTEEVVRDGFIWWSTNVLWGYLIEVWGEKARLGARDACWVEGEREMPWGNKVGEFPDKFLLLTRRALFPRELFPSEVTKRLWKVTGMRKRNWLALWLGNRVQ